MKEKISLAGDLGSGKSTVSKILIERLGAEYYSTGSIVRSIAEKRGMTVVELNVYMEDHPEIDREIDAGVAALSEIDKTLIIDSRMAWHFTKGTFKVYLSTDVETSALRIMSANRKGEHALTLEETIAETRTRTLSERKRYMTQYGVNIKDLFNYDLIVDTTYATPGEIAECIISSFESWQRDKSFKCAYISPERLNYPDDEQDAELVAAASQSLELTGTAPEVRVFESDGSFYIKDGAPSALAYAFSSSPFVPTTLIRGEIGEGSFVKMKNSL